jgi:hypothetical protein
MRKGEGSASSQPHLFGKKLVAVGVEGRDGVALEVDWELRWRESEVGICFEELEDAEAVDSLGAGVDKEVAPLEFGTQGLPEVMGAKLLSQKGAHGRFNVSIEEGGEGIEGGLDGIEPRRAVEGVALLHALHSTGNGGTGAEGDSGRGASLGADGQVAAAVGLGELAD